MSKDFNDVLNDYLDDNGITLEESGFDDMEEEPESGYLTNIYTGEVQEIGSSEK